MKPLLLAALFALGCSVAAQSAASTEPDVIYVPTPQPVVEAMLEVAAVKPDDVVYDLGSGDGRIVITAAQKYGARGVGIEIDPALVKKATDNAAAAGVSDRVRFLSQNLFDADISQATVVTLYLLQSINERLRPKLVRELKPGTRIVSHVFNMGPEWPAEQKLMIGPSPVFFYRIAAGGQAAKPDEAVPQADDQLAAAGKKTTEDVCTQCHGMEDVIAQRRTPREWNDVVTEMVDRGASGTREDVATIKRYLTRYYGSVRVNTASAADLSSVLGLSSKDADSIIEYRKAHGNFSDAAALAKVPDIDKTKIDAQPNALRFD